MSLRESICSLAERNLGPVRYSHAKATVEDPIYGSFQLEPWETSLSQTPIMQRLKRIHQMGVAFHVYFAAVHTRFEHSLGTTFLAGEVLRSFEEELPHVSSKRLLYEIRLAALVHDIGHSPFSHLGERLWHRNANFQKLSKEEKFRGAKPHEIISYLIVNSEPFKEYLQQLTSVSPHPLDDIRIDSIGEYILGFPGDSNSNWLAQIVNGSQIPDVDRLDYVARDSYFSGLNTTIDTRRVIRSFGVSATEAGHMLVFDPGIVPTFERMVFNKAQLYKLVYHNVRVLGLEQIFLKLCDRLAETEENPKGIQPLSDLFLLDLDDMFWLTYISQDKIANSLLDKLRNGIGMVRCLEVSRTTVKEDSVPNLFDLFKLGDKQLKEVVEQEIYKRMPSHCTKWDVSLCIPSLPTFAEVDCTMLQFADHIGPLNSMFPIDIWISAYLLSHWKVFVFSTEETRDAVGKAASEVLSEIFGLRFVDSATRFQTL